MSLITKLSNGLCKKLSTEQVWTPIITTVRYRYHKDKIAQGPLHRLGYKDKILTEGLLPRHKDFEKIKVYFQKDFVPNPEWTPKQALFGRNDYIDILGDGRLKPEEVCYNVPKWLQGFQGNEFQMLLRRRAAQGNVMREYWPSRYFEMERRIKYLYKHLNTKKKDTYWKTSRSMVKKEEIDL
ncbi:UNVERIFIED_CONTAM: hypothetical protein RMT77_010926 [Armadillidium vulgare]